MDTSSKRLAIAWLFLVAITVIYAGIDHSTDDSGVLVASTTVTISAIALALIKFRTVMHEFMAIRHAPPPLRRLTDLVVVVIGVSLLASYLVGQAVA